MGLAHLMDETRQERSTALLAQRSGFPWCSQPVTGFLGSWGRCSLFTQSNRFFGLSQGHFSCKL